MGRRQARTQAPSPESTVYSTAACKLSNVTSFSLTIPHIQLLNILLLCLLLIIFMYSLPTYFISYIFILISIHTSKYFQLSPIINPHLHTELSPHPLTMPLTSTTVIFYNLHSSAVGRFCRFLHSSNLIVEIILTVYALHCCRTIECFYKILHMLLTFFLLWLVARREHGRLT